MSGAKGYLPRMPLHDSGSFAAATMLFKAVQSSQESRPYRTSRRAVTGGGGVTAKTLAFVVIVDLLSELVDKLG